MPPRNLPKLANEYHGDQMHVFAQASSINYFQEPPEWALRASIPSEWSLKRSLRKKNVSSKPEPTTNAVAEIVYPRAAIACGMAPDDTKIVSKRQFWSRKRLRISAVVVGIVAIALGLINDRGLHILDSSSMKYAAKSIIRRATFGVHINEKVESTQEDDTTLSIEASNDVTDVEEKTQGEITDDVEEKDNISSDLDSLKSSDDDVNEETLLSRPTRIAKIAQSLAEDAEVISL